MNSENDKGNDLSHLLIEHKKKVCNSMLSKIKKEHLVILIKLSETLYIDSGRFYCLSLAIEQTNKNIKDITVGDLLEIIEEQEKFHNEIIGESGGNVQ